MVLAVDWLPMSDRGKELMLRLAWTMRYVSANGACGEWAIAEVERQILLQSMVYL